MHPIKDQATAYVCVRHTCKQPTSDIQAFEKLLKCVLTLWKALFFMGTLAWGAGPAAASSVTFKSRELFRIPFGTDHQDIGSKIEGGNFIFPRDFTMDAAGHFYVYDTNNHRIARFSQEGKYEIGYAYPATAGQVFAHADSRANLWLLLSDPGRGMWEQRGSMTPKAKAFGPDSLFAIQPISPSSR